MDSTGEDSEDRDSLRDHIHEGGPAERAGSRHQAPNPRPVSNPASTDPNASELDVPCATGSESASPDRRDSPVGNTPPLTPAVTPQREDTPAPENLSLRKPGSPQLQQTSLPSGLGQAHHSPPPHPLTVNSPRLQPAGRRRRGTHGPGSHVLGGLRAAPKRSASLVPESVPASSHVPTRE